MVELWLGGRIAENPKLRPRQSTYYNISICASNRLIALGGGAFAASITMPVIRTSKISDGAEAEGIGIRTLS
jgi:hypothetical protein